jgi:uncharacterized membrane protein (Fun14 family)
LPSILRHEDAYHLGPVTEAPSTTRHSGFWAWLRALPRWKKVLLCLALVLVAAGVAFAILETQRPPAAPPPAADSGARTSFLPGEHPSSPTTTASAEEPVSAGFFRLGFSFIAGFCIGLAVRKTLKLTALVAGLLLLCLFLLDYAGLITVNWQGFDGLYQQVAQRVERESAQLRTFITGSLPAAGLAALGLFAGFKKS